MESFLKPIAVVLRFIGIPFHSSDLSSSSLCDKLQRIWGWILFLFHLVACVIVINLMGKTHGQSKTKTISWTLYITLSNEILFRITNHLSLLLMPLSSKKSTVWKIISELWPTDVQLSKKISLTILIIFAVASFIFPFY